MSDKITEMSNFIMREMYLKEIEYRDHVEVIITDKGKKKYIYPKEKDFFGCSKQNYFYRLLREKFPEVSSSITTQLNSIVYKKFNQIKNDLFKNKISLVNYKENTPIPLANQQYNLLVEHNNKNNCDEFIVSFSLNSGEKRLKFILHKRNKSQNIIFQRIVNGTYKKGMAQLQYNKRKKKWMLVISYSFEKENDVNFIEGRRMGIDLGINNALYWGFNDNLSRERIEGKEILSFRNKIEKIRISRLRIAGKAGHGRKRKLLPTEIFEEKIRNFRNTINHKYAKIVVNEALKKKCGIIILENLKGITEGKDKFLKNWTYYDLQQKIIQKAEENNITIIKIDPKYTSQRCSKCGYIHKDNRKKEKFKCLNCGFEAYADYNAARNIATPNIEKIIEDTIKNNPELNELELVV
jgi:IS605 OrfB family transposase